MNIKSAEDLFTSELREIYSAERQLHRALPRLAKAVKSEKVQQHMHERVEHGNQLLEALDQVFDEMNVSKGREKNHAVEGLLDDAEELTENVKEDKLRDAALIGAVHKLEHYCIASWGAAAMLGRELGKDKAAETFEQAMKQGQTYDDQLVKLAKSEFKQ